MTMTTRQRVELLKKRFAEDGMTDEVEKLDCLLEYGRTRLDMDDIRLSALLEDVGCIYQTRHTGFSWDVVLP